MVGGGRPLLPEILGQNWPRSSEIANFQSIFARRASAVTPSKKVQLTLHYAFATSLRWKSYVANTPRVRFVQKAVGVLPFPSPSYALSLPSLSFPFPLLFPFPSPYIPPLPFPLFFPTPPSPFFSFPSLPSLLLEVGPFKSSYRVWGRCKLPAGSGAEPQSKSNLVHFSLKSWHLVATILIIFLRIKWPNFVHIKH